MKPGAARRARTAPAHSIGRAGVRRLGVALDARGSRRPARVERAGIARRAVAAAARARHRVTYAQPGAAPLTGRARGLAAARALAGRAAVGVGRVACRAGLAARAACRRALGVAGGAGAASVRANAPAARARRAGIALRTRIARLSRVSACGRVRARLTSGAAAAARCARGGVADTLAPGATLAVSAGRPRPAPARAGVAASVALERIAAVADADAPPALVPRGARHVAAHRPELAITPPVRGAAHPGRARAGVSALNRATAQVGREAATSRKEGDQNERQGREREATECNRHSKLHPTQS